MTIRRRISRLEQQSIRTRRGEDMTDDELTAYIAENDPEAARELAATGTISDDTLRRIVSE